MVDKNGKLFGKINLIDLLIILVIVAVIAFVALRATGVVGGGSRGAAEPVRISFYAEEVPDYVLDYIVAGEPVKDYTEDTAIGTVESFETGEPTSYEVLFNGEQQPIAREGHSSVSLVMTADAVLSENGATISGELYAVGHSMVILAGQAKMYVKVSGIEAAS